MMKLMRNGCCFCFSLRTGGLILGWLHTIIGFLFGIFFFGSLAYVLPENSKSDSIYIGNREFMKKTAFISDVSEAGIYSLFLAICAVLLIVGIKKNHHEKLIPFMVFLLLDFAFNINDIIDCTITGVYDQMFKILVRLILHNYYLFVIYSLYVKIKNGENSSKIPPV